MRGDETKPRWRPCVGHQRRKRSATPATLVLSFIRRHCGAPMIIIDLLAHSRTSDIPQAPHGYKRLRMSRPTAGSSATSARRRRLRLSRRADLAALATPRQRRSMDAAEYLRAHQTLASIGDRKLHDSGEHFNPHRRTRFPPSQSAPRFPRSSVVQRLPDSRSSGQGRASNHA